MKTQPVQQTSSAETVHSTSPAAEPQAQNPLQQATSLLNKLFVHSAPGPVNQQTLDGIPNEVLLNGILPKLSTADTKALRATNTLYRSLVPLKERSTSSANLHQTLQTITSEHLNDKSARHTDTLTISGPAELAHFANLPICPKVTKLVLELTAGESNDITQETPLHIARTFPNLTQISSNGLSPASGKIISEMLATKTFKSLKLQNIRGQEDTLSGPLHSIPVNHLSELVYNEAPGYRGISSFNDLFTNLQFEKLLETSQNLNTLSLSGEFDLSNPTPSVQTMCQQVHKMKKLTQFEMKNALNMKEEFMAYMIGECSNLEHLNLSNNPQGVGTSLNILLGNRADDTSKAILPKLTHITFWNNATREPDVAVLGAAFHQQVGNSLKQLGTHEQRLNQLDLKVGDLVDEQAVIDASQSLKEGGTLTLGQSQQVTENTVAKIKAQRPDLHITFQPN